MARVIEIKVEADGSKYEAMVTRIREQNRLLYGEGQANARQSIAAFERFEQGGLRARNALIPLQATMGQVTALLSNQFSPAAGVAVQTIDRFVFSVSTARGAGQNLAAALATGVSAALNPWVLAMTAVAAGTAYFASILQTTKREKEDFDKAMRSADVEFFKKKVEEAESPVTQLRDRVKELREALAGVTGGRGAAALRDLERRLTEAEGKQGKAAGDLAEAQRQRVLKTLPDLERELEVRNNLLRATEQQKPGIQAQAEIDKLAAAGARPEDLERVRKLRLENAALETAAIDRREREKKLTEERAQAEKELSEWFQRNNQLAAINEKIARGIAATKEEERKATEAIFDKEQERARNLGEIQQKIAAGLIATRESEINKAKTLSDLEAERLEILGHSIQGQAVLLQGRLQELAATRALALEQDKSTAVIDAQILNAQERLQRVGQITINWSDQVARTTSDIFNSAIAGTLKLADVGQSALLGLGRAVTDALGQAIREKFKFETVIFDNMRGLAPQMNQAFTAGAVSLPGGAGGGLTGGGGGGLLDSLGGLNIGGFNLGSIGMMLGQGALGFGLGSLVGGGRSGSGIGGALGALSIPGLLNMAAPSLFGTATLTGAVSAAMGEAAGAIFGNFVLPGVGAIVGGLLGALVGGLFTSRPKKSTLGIGTTFEGIQSSPFGFGVGDIESIVTAVRRTKGAEVGFPGQVESIGLAVAGGVVDVLNIFPDLVRRQLDAEIAQANQAAAAALNFTVTGRGKKFQRNLNAFMASLPGVVLDAFQPVVLKAFQVALEPFGVSPGGAEFFSGGSIEDRFNALQSVAQISARAGDLSKFFFGAEKGFVGQGLERLFNTGSAAETQAAAQRFGQTSQGVFEAAAERQQFTRNLAGEMAASLADAINNVDPRFAFDQFLGKFETSIEGLITGALQQAFIARNIQPILEGPAFLGIMERFEQVGRGDLSAQLAFEQSQGDLGTLRTLIFELRPTFEALAQLGRSLTNQTASQLGLSGSGSINITINGDVSGEEDVRELARRIEAMLRGQLAPA